MRGGGGVTVLGQKTAGPSGAVLASIMMALMPITSVLVMWVYKRTTPSTFTMGCILVAFLGVSLVITKGDIGVLSSTSGNLMPALLILTGVFGWVIYTVGASSFPGWSPLRYTTLTALSGAVTIAAITATATALGLITAPSVHQTLALAPQTAYMIIPATVVAVLAWNMGIKRLGAQNTVLFINLVPLTTLAIAIAQGYKVVGIELVGVAVTILAVTGNNVWQRRAAAPTTTYAETSVAKAA